MADYEAGPELIDQLRHGQKLVLETADADNSPISSTLPLAGFAQAYDGPPLQPKQFELKQGRLQEELDRRARRRFCTFLRFIWVPTRPATQVPSMCSVLEEVEAKPPIRRCDGQ
jgi:hypothetical protein